ncbi:MAG: type I methionyl aminopeptidase [Chitinispirillaceae bacterium]|nr:type I methionyl aminopeptidase [Chitinispirillaceae bacterium]
MIGRNDPCWCGSGKKYKKCHLIQDQATSAALPPRQPRRPSLKDKKLIKSPHDIEGMERAGVFNGELLDYIRPLIKAGISTGEIDTLVHDYTVSHGHTPACLGYLGYPKSVCTSINNVVCHGIPSSKEVLREGDIVNVDLTSIVDGYYGDSSETFMIGAVSEEARHLVMVTAEAMIRGIDAVRPGVPLAAIAEAIEPFVVSKGCSVVHQYTGHGIGKKFHEHFTVYHHIDRDCEPVILTPGMTLTIEPMINRGGWDVVTDQVDGWTVRTRDGSLSAQFEHTVLVTEGAAKVLTLTPSQKASGVRLSVDGISFG